MYYLVLVAYQRWNLPPKYRHQMDVYEPPADPFDGMSSYQMSYVGRRQPVRPSMKPDDAAHMSAEPLDDVTTVRAAYVRHPLPDVEPRQKSQWLPNPAGLDDLTNYRKEYTRKGQGSSPSSRLLFSLMLKFTLRQIRQNMVNKKTSTADRD